MKTLLPIFLLITSCSYLNKHESKEPDGSLPLDALKAKYDTVYQEVLDGLDPVTGWISNTDCDGLLFNSLAGALGFPVDIGLAEYSPGEMHRRPFKACFTESEGDVGSKSTISRDMLIGYMSYLWAKKDLGGFQRLADYGEKHDWIMGSPSSLISRVLLTGNGIGTIGRAIFTLSSGGDDRYYRRVGYLFPPVEADFERHIQVQGILLQDELDDAYNLKINDEMLDRLIENAAASPDDPLFAAALGRFTGDQTKAFDLLLKQDNTCPTYARGEKPDVYCKLNWLQSAKIVLGE